MNRSRRSAAEPAEAPRDDVAALLTQAGRGDDTAFENLYDAVSPRVYGLVLRVVRDPAQAEEVTQEVLVEIWRTSPRFDPARGSASNWILTLAHRRAVDWVRSTQAAAARDHRDASAQTPDYDVVAETVDGRLERQQVLRCLRGLTDVQREAIELAYYGGRSYREVAESLDLPLPTVKTRMRDALIRLRDCLGVSR
ncbi:ECF RNA polymerase sigma factor SigK [Cryptosporangium phraense]|uniref:Sigma-70 family RNA polymerase sigma factor n=1 Tax=Cryptosporangium phraense TaxID=2593070 RepID=A0A545AS09_9ACTN|nr:ECF RNA polymerase sigma factor SigK [Cryptosporangium phraense]TQS44099.1 sigma-70 family RNA polymerase sigma factor [Cryptosporangium phraense]